MDALTFLESVSGYSQSKDTGSASRPIRCGKIAATYNAFVNYPNPPPLPTVVFDGESAASGKQYPYVNGFLPAPNQRVWLVPVGTTYLICGAVSNPGVQGFYADPVGNYYSTEFGDGTYIEVNAGATYGFINGDLDVAGSMTVGGAPVRVNCNGVTSTGPASDTSTSASYVNLGGTSSFSFTKYHASTRVKIEMTSTSWATVGGTINQFGVNISGGIGDYDVCQIYFNPASTHLQAAGFRIVPAFAAGTYTIQGRWRRTTGTGTMSRDANDWLSICATEIIE